MPNTTNFNWVTPADTDLVKDGAAAIRTLGNNIDASLVDLKGGTTGQVLAKASNADLDYTWSNVDPLTILDAKGDLISATAADTPARLAVGTDGQVLTADSSTATGLKWATAASTPTLNEEIFTSSGTFNVPSGVSKVWVEIRGGGGGGGGGTGSYSGGGGGGAALVQRQVTVTPGGTVSVTIGGGGSGGASDATGSSGSQTSFGATTASGGAAGRKESGGSFGINGMGNGGGQAPATQTTGGAASANTGAGGAGGTGASAGGNGGSGIVIVRWLS